MKNLFCLTIETNDLLIGSVSDPDWIRIQSGQWIRIRNPDPDPGGQKLPAIIEKVRNFMFEVNVYCHFQSKKILNFFCRNFFSIFGHQNPGSGSVPVFILKCWIRIRITRIRIRNTAYRYRSAKVVPVHVD
jgi:hypothetical protein